MPSSDSFSVISSGPADKPTISYGHHGHHPTTLQKEPSNSDHKNYFWLILMVCLIFAKSTSTHNFESKIIQKHPLSSLPLLLLPYLSFNMHRSSRRNGTGKSPVPTPSPPDEKTKKRRDDPIDEEPSLTDKKAKTSGFHVMDVDLYAPMEEMSLDIPKGNAKFKDWKFQLSDDEAVKAATPFASGFGEGDTLHESVKWLKKRLMCLLEGTNEIDLNAIPKQGFSHPLLVKMFNQLMGNKLNEEVVLMTVGDEVIPLMKILVMRMAHSPPLTLWPGQVKNGKIPSTQEGRFWVAAVTAVGPFYKATKSSKKLLQMKLS